eukprot:TRINITY_DN450_c0_g3_i1.p1 TRINITY_DN450_c0_g3~~TRINITY_DN450_c0_g3_i1.p1  ORF type:complete len:130 (+),score=14.10 TRINITY_DN450_c0_g3_i1:154-543(+)
MTRRDQVYAQKRQAFLARQGRGPAADAGLPHSQRPSSPLSRLVSGGYTQPAVQQPNSFSLHHSRSGVSSLGHSGSTNASGQRDEIWEQRRQHAMARAGGMIAGDQYSGMQNSAIPNPGRRTAMFLGHAY